MDANGNGKLDYFEVSGGEIVVVVEVVVVVFSTFLRFWCHKQQRYRRWFDCWDSATTLKSGSMFTRAINRRWVLINSWRCVCVCACCVIVHLLILILCLCATVYVARAARRRNDRWRVQTHCHGTNTARRRGNHSHLFALIKLPNIDTVIRVGVASVCRWMDSSNTSTITRTTRCAHLKLWRCIKTWLHHYRTIG